MGKKYTFKYQGDTHLILTRKDGKDFCMYGFLGMSFFFLAMGLAGVYENHDIDRANAASAAASLLSVTAAPTTSAPTSAAPTSMAPTLAGATTSAPTSAAPTTSAPTDNVTTANVTTAPTAALTFSPTIDQNDKSSTVWLVAGSGVFLVAILFGGLIGGCKRDVMTISTATTPWTVEIAKVAWGGCTMSLHTYALADGVKAETGSKTGSIKRGKRTTAYAVTLPLDMSLTRAGKMVPELRVWAGNAQKAAGVERRINEFLYPHKTRDDPFFSQAWQPTMMRGPQQTDLDMGESPALWGSPRPDFDEDVESDWKDLENAVEQEWEDHALSAIRSVQEHRQTEGRGRERQESGIEFDDMVRSGNVEVAMMFQARETMEEAESERLKQEMDQMQMMHEQLTRDQELGQHHENEQQDVDATLSALSHAIWQSKQKLKFIGSMPKPPMLTRNLDHNYDYEDEDEDAESEYATESEYEEGPLTDKQKRAQALQARLSNKQKNDEKSKQNQELLANGRSVLSRLKRQASGGLSGHKSNPRPVRHPKKVAAEKAARAAEKAAEAAEKAAEAAARKALEPENELIAGGHTSSRSVMKKMRSNTPTRRPTRKKAGPPGAGAESTAAAGELIAGGHGSSRSVITQMKEAAENAVVYDDDPTVKEDLKQVARAKKVRELSLVDAGSTTPKRSTRSQSQRAMSMMMSAVAIGAVDLTDTSSLLKQNAGTPRRNIADRGEEGGP